MQKLRWPADLRGMLNLDANNANVIVEGFSLRKIPDIVGHANEKFFGRNAGAGVDRRLKFGASTGANCSPP